VQTSAVPVFAKAVTTSESESSAKAAVVPIRKPMTARDFTIVFISLLWLEAELLAHFEQGCKTNNPTLA
jgi:hypothetical protein